MAERFHNSSPGALTIAQAIEREKKRVAEHRRQVRQARELAAQGRGNDTEIAHVTPGELVVPRQLQTPEFMAALSRAATEHNIPLEKLSIGNAKNRINPNTGAPEFWFDGFGNGATGFFGNDGGEADEAQTPATGPGTNTPAQTDPSNGAATSECPNGYKVVQMNVTAYTNGPESTGKRPGDPGYGETAGRTIAGPGTIAAPPAYKFGTKMYVPGYGWGIVNDTGTAIKGNHLDVWFETVEEARRWDARI